MCLCLDERPRSSSREPTRAEDDGDDPAVWLPISTTAGEINDASRISGGIHRPRRHSGPWGGPSPLIDWTAIGKQIEQIKQLTDQLDTLKQQLQSTRGCAGIAIEAHEHGGRRLSPKRPDCPACPARRTGDRGASQRSRWDAPGPVRPPPGGRVRQLPERREQLLAREVARSAKEQAESGKHRRAGSEGRLAPPSRNERATPDARLAARRKRRRPWILIARLNAEQYFLCKSMSCACRPLRFVQRARSESAERRREEGGLRFQDEVGRLIKAR